MPPENTEFQIIKHLQEKLSQAKYHFEAANIGCESPDILRFEYSAFLAAYRSVIQYGAAHLSELGLSKQKEYWDIFDKWSSTLPPHLIKALDLLRSLRNWDIHQSPVIAKQHKKVIMRLRGRPPIQNRRLWLTGGTIIKYKIKNEESGQEHDPFEVAKFGLQALDMLLSNYVKHFHVRK